jgi:hypothetical protein
MRAASVLVSVIVKCGKVLMQSSKELVGYDSVPPKQGISLEVRDSVCSSAGVSLWHRSNSVVAVNSFQERVRRVFAGVLHKKWRATV